MRPGAAEIIDGKGSLTGGASSIIGSGGATAITLTASEEIVKDLTIKGMT